MLQHAIRSHSIRSLPPPAAWALVIIFFGLCQDAAFTDEQRPPQPLNIVFIIADDLGVMDTSPYNPACFYDTPNIQTLADTGMRFTDGYAACPVCSPTRSSVLTGQWPARTRNTDFFGGPNQFFGQRLPQGYEPSKDGNFGR
ncbi:MAG: hypothetical protein EBU59_12790, partial [Planctomycetia bacterium]|nr:hypothetical protein [Planctomycetia bacterium]